MAFRFIFASICALAVVSDAILGAQEFLQEHRRHEETPTEDPCTLVKLRNHDNRNEVHFRRREVPARIVDFFQFGSVHELPILRMRLAEMGPFVDEVHIAEGDRDFSGNKREVVLHKLLASDPELARWRGKIVHHKVDVEETCRFWRIRPCEGYGIQRAVINAKYNFTGTGTGVLLEGDLDEIVSRTVLKSLKHCIPVKPKRWMAGIQMDTFKYNMGWSAGSWWQGTIAHDIEAFPKEDPHSLLEAGKQQKYVIQVSNFVHVANGSPAGWHLGWMLDGADGIAHKIMTGIIEGKPSWARSRGRNEKELAAWLSKDFLPDPTAYDSGLKESELGLRDLPECAVEDPYKYKELLGDAFSVALGLPTSPRKHNSRADVVQHVNIGAHAHVTSASNAKPQRRV